MLSEWESTRTGIFDASALYIEWRAKNKIIKTKEKGENDEKDNIDSNPYYCFRLGIGG